VISPEKLARLARVYDDEIVPSYAGRLAGLLIKQLGAKPLRDSRHVVEIGCATGHLTRELAAAMTTPGARVTAIDERDPFIAEARARPLAGSGAHVEFQRAELDALPIANGEADVALSNLVIAESALSSGAAGAAPLLAELRRVLAPRGRVVVGAPLRGTWSELLDLLRDVLREGHKTAGLSALDRYASAFPDGAAATEWLRAAGFVDVELVVDRWQILFKSAREFFFAPLIELGPLSQWKQLAGRGPDMQDAFFFTKEAIDSYFKGRPFAVTVVAAAVSGRNPG
jgi:SAM-dependent methyltransferase